MFIRLIKPAGIGANAVVPIRRWQHIVVIQDVEMHRSDDLLEVVDVSRFRRLIFSLAQNRQQQRGEDPDDGDGPQQFNQGKCALRSHPVNSC
jgi:hypothetical protein